MLSSCSAPPPKEEPDTAPARPSVVHRLATETPSRAKTAQQAKVTTTEVPPSQQVTPRRHANRPRAAGYPGELTHISDPSKIAITLDAGASPAPTPSILKTLREAGVHVTFFLTGKWCEQNPDLVREISAEGHEIGNHSYSHPDFRKLTDAEMLDQVDKTEQIITRLTGVSPKPLFRPPFGGRDKHVLGVVGSDGYRSIYWSLDSWDAFKKGITSGEIEDRVLNRVQGGDIILMHCGSAATAAALPDILSKLQQRGFQIVKISELIEKD